MILKKLLFAFFFTFIFISLFLFLDLILSKTVLNYNSCLKVDRFYYELKKNCSSKYRFKKNFPIVETITDNLGQRVGDEKKIKDKNKKNIFIFGDSFTYGVGIKYDSTYVGLISKKKIEYNIYNFAVGSYSPSVYLYKLTETIKNKIFPEKIIVFLDLTDVFDEATRWKYDEETNELKLTSDYLYKEVNKKKKFTKENFKISNNIASYLNYKLRSLREKKNIKFNNKRKIKTSIQGSYTYRELDTLDKNFWKKDNFNKGISLLKKRIFQISDISKENNIEFYLVIYPWAETLEFGQQIFSWSNFGKQICENSRCTLIDTIPNFEKYKENNKSWSSDLYFINDEHFNEGGARLLYESVINKIN